MGTRENDVEQVVYTPGLRIRVMEGALGIAVLIADQTLWRFIACIGKNGCSMQSNDETLGKRRQRDLLSYCSAGTRVPNVTGAPPGAE